VSMSGHAGKVVRGVVFEDPINLQFSLAIGTMWGAVSVSKTKNMGM